ncbi:MAG: carboxypeptidase-like regulatory domain-containing protein [Acidimicrobiales bacterium]
MRLPSTRRRARRLAALVGLVVLAATACGGGGDDPGPTTTAATLPPPSSTSPPTTAPVITLPGAPRTSTTVPVSLGPGNASLSGTVVGPDGPVEGAVVRVERLVSRNPAVADLRTDGSGRWSIDSVLGGPYRVKAFRPPELGQLMPEVLFLGADERRDLALNVSRFGDNSITATVAPNPPVVDQVADVIIRVGVGRVGEDGSLVIEPKPAVRLQFDVTEGLTLESSGAELTDGDGRATFRVRCQTPGSFQVTLLVGSGVTHFSLPGCVPGPPPPG